MYRQIKYVMLATAILNVVLSVILGKLIGLSGILFATTIANMLTAFWYEPKLLFRQYFGRSPFVFYRDYLLNFLVTGAGMALCYFAVKPVRGVNVFTFVLKGVIIVAIMGVVFAIRYCRTPEFKAIIAKAMSLVKKFTKRA